ncbi:MAG: FAD-dependent oxidoreductase [Acidobacteriaceae bacterium]
MNIQQHPEIEARFADLHPPLGKQSATIEANRCLNCFDAPCTSACPTHIDVPGFIRKIASGNLAGSAQSILAANILGASCARACPVQLLCEGACVMRPLGEKPIEIGRLQRYAMDAFLDEFEAGRAGLQKKTEAVREQRVACIGAGPASLACAAELAMQGFQATIFDKRPLPGGLNTYGVAEYKLPSNSSLREVKLVRSLGVEFEFNREIANEAELERLEGEFEAVFIGVGLGAMHKLGIPGEENPGVVDALEFIAGYKTGDRVEVGRSVVVVGAGNTAIDAANAAKRLGAAEVHILYRRTAEHIPAFQFEFEQARKQGVRFHWQTQPVAIHAQDDGTASVITALECQHVRETESGELRLVEKTNFHLPCDMVIPAIGQSPLVEFLTRCRGIELNHGRVVVDRATGRTSNARYYAGGDCVNGGREVVDAVADGKRAGAAIAQALLEQRQAVAQ